MLSDREIISGCREGKEKAYKALVEQYAPRLMATALRYLSDPSSAEDAVQESFIRVFQSIHKYEHQDQLFSWLKKITVNQCLKVLRSKVIWLHQEDIVEINVSVEMEEMDPLEDHMTKAMQQLPEAYRLVFNLNIADGYSHAEIADILGITESSSRVYLTRARVILKNYLLKCNNTGYVSGIS